MGILPKNVCHGARLPRLFANNGMTSLGCHPVLPFGLYTAILRLQKSMVQKKKSGLEKARKRLMRLALRQTHLYR